MGNAGATSGLAVAVMAMALVTEHALAALYALVAEHALAALCALLRLRASSWLQTPSWRCVQQAAM